jgi:hypothetical protein
MSPIRTWDRRRRVGPFLLFQRRDQSGVRQRGVTMPRSTGGHPRLVLRFDSYGGEPHVFAVAGGREVRVMSEALADSADEAPGRRFAGLVWSAKNNRRRGQEQGR